MRRESHQHIQAIFLAPLLVPYQNLQPEHVLIEVFHKKKDTPSMLLQYCITLLSDKNTPCNPTECFLLNFQDALIPHRQITHHHGFIAAIIN